MFNEMFSERVHSMDRNRVLGAILGVITGMLWDCRFSSSHANGAGNGRYGVWKVGVFLTWRPEASVMMVL